MFGFTSCQKPPIPKTVQGEFDKYVKDLQKQLRKAMALEVEKAAKIAALQEVVEAAQEQMKQLEG